MGLIASLRTSEFLPANQPRITETTSFGPEAAEPARTEERNVNVSMALLSRPSEGHVLSDKRIYF